MPEGAFSTQHLPKLDEARQLHCYPGQDPTKNAPAKKAWRPARSWWPATLQTSKKSQAYGGGVRSQKGVYSTELIAFFCRTMILVGT